MSQNGNNKKEFSLSEGSLFTKRESSKVRPPGFGPGSTAWKADVLDQTRLRPPVTARALQGNIVNGLIKLKALGKTELAVCGFLEGLVFGFCGIRVFR